MKGIEEMTTQHEQAQASVLERKIARLNAEQLLAVTSPPNKSTFILAGAGSGKTSVLTTRIGWLLKNGYANDDAIMAVTFTNKAAKEMRERLFEMFDFNPKRLIVGTFHSICLNILRENHEEADLKKNFTIMAGNDQLAFVKRLIKDHAPYSEIDAKELIAFINKYKEQGIRAKNVNMEAIGNSMLGKQKVELYALYENKCRTENQVDFAELLLRTVELFQENPKIARKYQKRFTHILIDEFQDTNHLQYVWLRLIAGCDPIRGLKGNAVFAVGDDDQSIYGWRGAEIQNIHHFINEFDTGAPIKLVMNYRSMGNILKAANSVIANNENRFGKDLVTGREDGDKIRCFRFSDEKGEAAHVAQECAEVKKNHGNLNEIAVLYRRNANSRAIEKALINANVPYLIYGGLRFYERKEVKDILAYLRLAANPNDNAAFDRIVNFPLRGIGTKTLEDLKAVAEANNVSNMAAIRSNHSFPSKAKFKKFSELMADLEGIVRTHSLPDAISEIITRTGIEEHYKSQREISEQERVENLRELVNAAAEYRYDSLIYDNKREAAEVAATNQEDMAANAVSNQHLLLIERFLAETVLDAGANKADTDKQARVQLMTVHAAKGLEFDDVFLVGLSDGNFPSSYALEDDEIMQEERRLMYVAITRARYRLNMCYPCLVLFNGTSQYAKQSSFFKELPPNVLVWFNKEEKKDNNGATSESKSNAVKGFSSSNHNLSSIRFK